jgi:hypothetical protein
MKPAMVLRVRLDRFHLPLVLVVVGHDAAGRDRHRRLGPREPPHRADLGCGRGPSRLIGGGLARPRCGLDQSSSGEPSVPQAAKSSARSAYQPVNRVLKPHHPRSLPCTPSSPPCATPCRPRPSLPAPTSPRLEQLQHPLELRGRRVPRAQRPPPRRRAPRRGHRRPARLGLRVRGPLHHAAGAHPVPGPRRGRAPRVARARLRPALPEDPSARPLHQPPPGQAADGVRQRGPHPEGHPRPAAPRRQRGARRPQRPLRRGRRRQAAGHGGRLPRPRGLPATRASAPWPPARTPCCASRSPARAWP